MIVERYEDKKQHLTFAIQYKYRKIECCSTKLNEAVVLLNDFIHYRNNKFKPTFQMRRLAMIEIPKAKLTKCQNDIYSVGSLGIKT
jgi:hypothetical protein